MMSWKTLNQILGLAAVDYRFWEALQQDPLAAVQAYGFELTAEEQEIFSTISAQDLAEFSQCLLNKLALDPQQRRSRKE